MPESKAGEVIDFLLYLKNKKEQDLQFDQDEIVVVKIDTRGDIPCAGDIE